MDLQFKFLLLITILALSEFGVNGDGHGRKLASHPGLSKDYYKHTCPQAEDVIRKAVFDEYDKDSEPAPGVLRLQFHDCFVEGCDGSVLLDGPGTEKTAKVNAELDGFDIIDIAKAAIEAACPGIVSCADVLAFAVRDSVVKMGGEYWEVPGGRKDGRVSIAEHAQAALPEPDYTVPELIANFAAKGLSAKQMVILSGAHTVGAGHCDKFVGRLYNYNEKYYTDPTIDPAYAEFLKQKCPEKYNITTQVENDAVTPDLFDTGYYQGLGEKKGLFTSDQELVLDKRTAKTVKSLLKKDRFLKKFGKAMQALAAVEVKLEGEVRKNCRVVNKY
ncbi:hypothetical protein R1flu_004345 [Riccia fluitans]|uniref:Peroxidase n=1 Tax=Riccia fluitans TaxID=41844 RepID=A0ABD1YQ10_9MARC